MTLEGGGPAERLEAENFIGNDTVVIKETGLFLLHERTQLMSAESNVVELGDMIEVLEKIVLSMAPFTPGNLFREQQVVLTVIKR